MTKEEHWAGVADAAMRRKLQNRLNKRASRQRKIQAEKAQPEIRPITFAEVYERLGQKVLFKPLSTEITAHNAALPQGQQESTSINMCTTLTSALVERTIDFSRYFATTYRTCITSSPDFRTYVARTSLYPLSVDHAVLTLMHFNLIRALTHNIEMLGVEPDQMMDDDCISPWTLSQHSPLPKKLVKVPPALRPTSSQLTIPHHPEIDILPFPRYRDNILLAGEKLDEVELCHDMVCGIDPRKEGLPTSCLDMSLVGDRTGFIVWSDPGLESSWEVDELFLRKWKWLFKGCHEILRSTNHWRKQRGERPLVIEL
ncbi:hypothetical protein BP6252_04181 [Coleophoma cylindrospora]|uniref:BZIP domain-containing protein n=1 Tax=Coleophoma cylindrospora TaxID=1849047 RepID=A0A3D8RZR5_9HELO|nr:hypothetical protein BP6252_04181 [Coleophoma cylindrospora]